MTDINVSAVTLAEIDENNEELLAAEMSRRITAGRVEEVADFLKQCPARTLNILARTHGDHAWQTDPAAWLALTRATLPRGVMLPEPPHALRQRDAAFSAELCDLAEQYLAGTGAERSAVMFVMNHVMGRLAYPGIPRARIFNLLKWNTELARAAGFADNEGYSDIRGLVNALPDTADLIALAGTSERNFDAALDVMRERPGTVRERWLPWHDFLREHPEYIDRHYKTLSDPVLIWQRWEAASLDVRKDMVIHLLTMVRWYEKGDIEYIGETLDRMMPTEGAFFAATTLERSYHFNLAAAKLIWQRQYPALLEVILPTMMGHYGTSIVEYKKLVPEILTARPDLLLSVPPVHLHHLIPLLDSTLLRTLLPDLGGLIAKSSSKALRDVVAKAARELAIADIVKAGWLNVRNKNLRLACKDLLMAHPDKTSASPLLQAMLDANQLDPASASTVEAWLGQGAPVAAPATGEAALAQLETQAAAIKRWSAAIKPFDTPELLAMFAPLSEHAARAALHLAATGDDGLPPLAANLLAQLAAERRARLALQLVEMWIGSDGNPKLRWVLRLALGGADDRIVDLLSSTALAWAKTRKQRAVIAVEQLALIDSLYALARVLDIAESKKVKGMVSDTALDALKAAAARRNLALGELLDELTPDFGLGKGITLTVGDATYQVVLQGDLSLRLVDAKGKVSKTLPANKDEATREGWETASSQFKTISTALKGIAKLQAPRMLAALVTAKSWSTPRWTQLFLDHAILKIMGRSLIWQTDGANPVSFRIAEDFSLLQADDEVVTLAPDARVSLWHPATARAGEIEAWRSNFADYEVTALIDQIGAPSAMPPAASMNDELLLAPAGVKVAQEKMASILTRCGYRKGPVNDGPSIDWHEWHLPAAELTVYLENGYCPPYMDIGNPIEIIGIRVRPSDSYNAVAPASLPAPLLATLWSHLQQLDAKRVDPAA